MTLGGFASAASIASESAQNAVFSSLKQRHSGEALILPKQFRSELLYGRVDVDFGRKPKKAKLKPHPGPQVLPTPPVERG